MESITGYRRNQDGTLDRIDLCRDADGPVDGLGFPLTHTDEVVELRGWGDDSGRVYLSGGGVEIIVPERWW